MRATLATLVLVAVSLAGCGTPVDPDIDFDGESAWQFTHDLVTYPDGSDRYRVPGTQGHADALDWLQAAMQVPGWTVETQTISGPSYRAIGGHAGEPWAESCPQEDKEDLDDLEFTNVFATFGPAPTVWLGAHWDSKEDASDGGAVLGANDGAAGVGVLLQFMRHVSAGDLDVDFGFGVVFFDGEDGFEDCHALAGSVAFANLHSTKVDRLILLDMVGDKDARFVREGHSVDSDPALVDLLWKHGAKYAPSAFTDVQRTVTDDHVPFIQEGVRAVDIIDAGRPTFFPPYWHTSRDRMNNIDAGMLTAVGNTVWATLMDPAFASSL